MLKFDISKYFYRVDHAVLMDILSRKIKDEEILRDLYKLINCENTAFGLPAGVQPELCNEEDWLLIAVCQSETLQARCSRISI